jgi:two-component system sensor histidine kinase KdpD
MADSDRDPNRPDPDALLALAGGDGRGKLTIFLGAAPGVGKTYAMLARAKKLRADGADIVIGLVETHGRRETAELVTGLEILPRRQVPYGNGIIEEFDIDEALNRKPKIIVVDELAHSNVEGSRHPKRYQDVAELLQAGINVWTALNIQHLESLSDIVADITGVTVREIVPDIVLQKADEVVLIDLTPAELITRLDEGKIYLPENAKRAADKFFRVGNLTALRELALRRTADRVDDQMVDYLRQNAIEGPWQTAERLIVCVGPDSLAEKVVRTASRLASGLNAPWLVVSVERTDRSGDGAALRRLDEIFLLAERLGAETRRIAGNDFVAEILKLARKEHATQIVIGAPRRDPLSRLFRQSLPQALLGNSEGFGIYYVTGENEAPRRRLDPSDWRWQSLPRDIATAVLSVAVATALGLSFDAIFPLPNVSLLYLLAVLVSAIREGYRAAFITALLSALTYNFSFIAPVGTLTIAQPHEVFAFVIFIIAALTAGGIASRTRDQAKLASERARMTEALYGFSSKLSSTAKADDVIWATVSQLQALLKRDAVIFLPKEGDGELQMSASWPPDTVLDVADMTAARWAYEKKEPAGAGTGTLPNSTHQFRPLMSPHGVMGVCGFGFDARPLDSNEERIWSAMADQSAIAIDRARLSREALAQNAKLEGDRFRSALLSSISHDLKTPLATITGAVTSLRQLGDKMNAESRDDLLQSIEEEGARLTRFVANLLDMTRIESGTVNPKRDWVDVADVVRGSVERAKKYFPGHDIDVSIAANLPLIRGDSVLLGQVLFNLIDNAIKYGGDEPVALYARKDGPSIAVSVTDMGRGIPAGELERIFEKFYRRSGKADGRIAGTGLGLAIARGFVEAMGGTIKAESPAVKKRGTRFLMRFPLPGAPETGEQTVERTPNPDRR